MNSGRCMHPTRVYVFVVVVVVVVVVFFVIVNVASGIDIQL